MKKQQTERNDADDPIFALPAEEQCDGPGGDNSGVVDVRADAELVERCLAGEVAAWEQLHSQCHEPLLASIRIMLGRQSSDESLVDEIAARVWYALIAKDGVLLAKYDSSRSARLVTFLRALARDQIARYCREEVRRRKRELSALRRHTRHRERDGSSPVDSLTEFLATLTTREKVFCGDYLLGELSETAQEPLSKANVWHRTHRIYQKLLRFLDRAP